MTPSLWFFVRWLFVLAVIDVAYSHAVPGFDGGSISHAVANIYYEYRYAKYVLPVGTLIAVALLQWHFVYYRQS